MTDDAGIRWPQKSRELHSHHFDSTIWNDFDFRDDDIVIGTYAKSGTTWVQQIVSQLLFEGAKDLEVAEMSPWMDLRFPPKEAKLSIVAAQEHRRFLKTHLPVDALVFSPSAKYVYIGRDGRDVLWSQYHHHTTVNDAWYDAVNNTPGLIGPPIEPPLDNVLDYWHEWIERDGYPWWSFWENIRSWWSVRDLPNVYLLHFSNLKDDMPGEIHRLAEFLDIPINEDNWDDILLHCSFEYMKANSSKSVPLGGAFWEGGSETFINKGTNGRWRDLLSADDVATYEKLAVEKLGADCAGWLATGQRA